MPTYAGTLNSQNEDYEYHDLGQRITPGQPTPLGCLLHPDELRKIIFVGNSMLVTVNGQQIQDYQLKNWVDHNERVLYQKNFFCLRTLFSRATLNEQAVPMNLPRIVSGGGSDEGGIVSKKGKVLDFLAADLTKVSIPKELWAKAHVAYIKASGEPVNRQEAVALILEQFVKSQERAAGSKNGKRVSEGERTHSVRRSVPGKKERPLNRKVFDRRLRLPRLVVVRASSSVG